MMPAQYLEVHRRVRALLEQGWCQYSHARSAHEPVGPFSPDAVGWCLLGAYISAYGGALLPKPLLALVKQTIREHFGTEGAGDDLIIPEWNDVQGRTQAQVLALMDRVITAAEMEESP